MDLLMEVVSISIMGSVRMISVLVLVVVRTVFRMISVCGVLRPRPV